MRLSAGIRLGTYEVVAPLGVGGMGEVYRARDVRLGRDVAIKILTASFAADAERIGRFEREAKTLALLNHPNIAAIYGFEDSGDAPALVMELVEGPTLADRIKSGPIPVDEAVLVAKQIAEGMEYAHERGIVHRDLKPANVKVSRDDSVKILDFGLAKAVEGEAAETDVATSPTLTGMATQAGFILGTAAYMSPEQAKGKPVDRRADIWAFGCVFYEMLTGKMAFGGETVTDILASVVRSEPDWSQLPQGTPLRARVLLQRCLQKDPKQRLRDIGDARISLDEIISGAPLEAPTPSELAGAPVRPLFGWIPAVIVATPLLLLAALAFVHFREKPLPAPALNLSVPVPADAIAGFVALSPDGRRLVIMLFDGEMDKLWIRSLDSPQLQLLPGTEYARAPFWSPDSKSIGFFAEGELKTVPATGGPPQVLCEGTGIGADGTWNRDGVILFSTSGVNDPLQRGNATGGACTVITHPEAGTTHVAPEFLPDGKHFVYVVRGDNEAARGLYLASLDNPAPRRLLTDDSSAVFAPSTTGKDYGYLLFLRGSNLMAQPFSAETLQLAGDAFPVIADASMSFNSPKIAASVSAGSILVCETNLHAEHQLTWLDRSGKDLGKVGGIQVQTQVALSPDANTAATLRRNQAGLRQGIWLYDLQRGGETRFTSPDLPGGAPVWSPDGGVIAFGGGKALYLKEVSSGLKEELLMENENPKTVSDWSRDGRYLIYTETDPQGRGDIWYLPDPLDKSSDHKPVRFQGTSAMESQGQLSPDGRWLAYTSNESGIFEIYVRPFPSGPGRWKISTGTRGQEPRWRRDGKELFFLKVGLPTNRLMAVAVQSGPRGDFKTGVPQELFEFRSDGYVPTSNLFSYSPSADGQKFLVHVQPDLVPTVNVITNWETAALANK